MSGTKVAKPAHHPVITALHTVRSSRLQLRAADAVTKFAGSMPFIYIHTVAFAVWIMAFERAPWPVLTLVVSLEAIFLSTFVMIGQNRQAEFAHRKADHDFMEQEAELHLNTELTKAIHDLAREIHAKTCK